MAKVKEIIYMVTLREEITIKPCQETTRKVLDLSEIDRMSPAFVYSVCFYRSCREKSASKDHSERLERSLEKVLIPWYPAAGRLKINGETGKLEIDCNGEGAIFKKAMTDARLEHLGKLHEYKSFYEKLVPLMPTNHDISQNPLVAVQITSFACGGYSIGFGFSHALFDGFGAFNFLASWAQISCGKDVMEPIHSRDTLSQAIASADTTHNQTYLSLIRDLCSIPIKMKESNDINSETFLSETVDLISDSGIQFVTLCVKRESIEYTKIAAIERGGLPVCSTFDVLAARIWKARVKAFKLQPTTDICLLFPVNARNRIIPHDLGKDFTGNALILVAIMCTAIELIKEPLEKTILRIQTAKNSVNDEYASAYVKVLESTEKVLPSMREVTIITDWMKFSFDRIDFAEGGPFAVSPVAPTVPEAVYLITNLEEKGVLVRLGIERHRVQDFIYHFNDQSYPSN